MESNSKAWIDVKIPYEPGAQLGLAYNRAMRETTAPWVLFLDHDLFCCNPHWYDMCLEAINRVGDQAGAITCMTNHIGNPAQKCNDAPHSNDLFDHIRYAKKRFQEYRYTTARIRGPLCGFFILTNRKVWEKVGGFSESRPGLNGVDNDYSLAFNRGGYNLYGMPGLYYYHVYKLKIPLQKGW